MLQRVTNFGSGGSDRPAAPVAPAHAAVAHLSVQARLLRACMRILVKRRLRADPRIDAVRRHLALVGRLVPRPPRGTVTTQVVAGGVKADLIATRASRPDRTILYLHGGSYVCGWPALYRDLTWRLATACRARVLCIDYRLAPEHPFPAALDDAATAYRWLLAQGTHSQHVAVMGDSAGGGLALALMLRLRDEGCALPAVAAVVSPWTDLTFSGASVQSNAELDPLIPVELAAEVVALC